MTAIRLKDLLDRNVFDMKTRIRIRAWSDTYPWEEWKSDVLLVDNNLRRAEAVKKYSGAEVLGFRAIVDVEGEPYIGISVNAHPVLAFEVEAPGFDMQDLAQCIVFAENAGQAKYIASLKNNVDFTSLRIRRLPWADKYGKYELIPADVFLTHGWGFYCEWCGETFYEDDEGYFTIDNHGLCPDCAKDAEKIKKVAAINQKENHRRYDCKTCDYYLPLEPNGKFYSCARHVGYTPLNGGAGACGWYVEKLPAKEAKNGRKKL